MTVLLLVVLVLAASSCSLMPLDDGLRSVASRRLPGVVPGVEFSTAERLVLALLVPIVMFSPGNAEKSATSCFILTGG